MTLSTLTRGEPWMTAHELDLNHKLIQGIAECLTARGVPETAFITLRVEEIATTWLLARRLEAALAPAEGEAPPCPTVAQVNAIGKCRERLRKAIKELEDTCAQTSPPPGQGLAERMLGTIQRVQATGPLFRETPDENDESNAPTPSTPSTQSTQSIRRGESTPSTQSTFHSTPARVVQSNAIVAPQPKEAPPCPVPLVSPSLPSPFAQPRGNPPRPRSPRRYSRPAWPRWTSRRGWSFPSWAT